MRHSRSASAIALLASGFFTTSASADITAMEVWENMVSLGDSSGYEITGTTSKSGNVLTVSDLALSYVTPEAAMTAALGDMTLTELGNGAVEITTQKELPFSFAALPNGGDEVEMTMVVRQSGLKTVVSGTAENAIYDYSADEIALSVDGMKVEGKQVDANIAGTMTALAGTYGVTTGQMRDVSSSGTAEKLAFSMGFDVPESAGKFNVVAEMTGVTTTSTGSLPIENSDPSNLAKMLEAGMSVDAVIDYKTSAYSMNFDTPDGTGKFEGGANGGEFFVKMGESSINYGGKEFGTHMTFSGMQLPFAEVTAAMESAAFNLKMPIAKTDAPANIALLTELNGLTINEDVWGMFDPTAVLPRDPATLVIDLTGKARWFLDIMNPEAMAETTSVPGELESVDINGIELSAAGASLTGNGAFTFDNSEVGEMGGAPKPAGTVNLKLVGGNGLMDRLVEMGLLPEDQVMGFRMMLGLFARPGEGDDTLVSEITMTEDGQVLANGQRLR